MPKTTDVRYYAIPDPDDSTRITYWRETGRKLAPWPGKVHYGPRLRKRDFPAGTPRQQFEYADRWMLEIRHPWEAKIRAAVDANPDEATARFAALTTRCGFCGKKLTDERSKVIGVGPDCRDGFPDELIARFVEAVGRAHAAHLGASDKVSGLSQP